MVGMEGTDQSRSLSKPPRASACGRTCQYAYLSGQQGALEVVVRKARDLASSGEGISRYYEAVKSKLCLGRRERFGSVE